MRSHVDPPSDQIHLEALTFYGYHGVHPEERALGQRFVVDVTIETDVRAASANDDLEQTVNYSTVYRTVQAIVEGESVRLVETLAERVARAILALDRVHAVRVRIAKPWAPLRGSTAGTVAVEIVRRRGE